MEQTVQFVNPRRMKVSATHPGHLSPLGSLALPRSLGRQLVCTVPCFPHSSLQTHTHMHLCTRTHNLHNWRTVSFVWPHLYCLQHYRRPQRNELHKRTTICIMSAPCWMCALFSFLSTHKLSKTSSKMFNRNVDIDYEEAEALLVVEGGCCRSIPSIT